MESHLKYGILVPLDLSDFNICVECIKGKYTKIKKKCDAPKLGGLVDQPSTCGIVKPRENLIF